MPDRKSEETALETVGALIPECRTTSARDDGPRSWITRNTCRSFILPSKLG
jgi:hypothetical protein